MCDIINDQLIQWAKEGYAPQLVYDDNGHWAVSFDSFGPADGAPDSVDGDLQWCDTPMNAVLAARDVDGRQHHTVATRTLVADQNTLYILHNTHVVTETRLPYDASIAIRYIHDRVSDEGVNKMSVEEIMQFVDACTEQVRKTRERMKHAARRWVDEENEA